MTSTATASRRARCPAFIRAAGISRAARATTSTPRTPRTRPSIRRSSIAWRASSPRRRPRCRRRRCISRAQRRSADDRHHLARRMPRRRARGGGPAARGRAVGRLHAHSRISVRGERARVHRSARALLCRRAESRRAAALVAGDRNRTRARLDDVDSRLRRDAVDGGRVVKASSRRDEARTPNRSSSRASTSDARDASVDLRCCYRYRESHMTSITKPPVRHPSLPKNALGFTRARLRGRDVDAVRGCGHDSVTAALVQALWELDLPPHRAAKMSGIGCSSKTTAYFLQAVARLQRRARTHAGARHRRERREQGARRTSASPATATRCRSDSGSSATRSAAT